MGELRVVSAPELTLSFGEESELRILYTEDGVPTAGAQVRVGFEGSAHDSTFSELRVDTDAGGMARVTLTAGSVPAAFRVRFTAELAAPAYVDVSVGNEGFGELRVTAVYGGARPMARRRVDVHADTSCDEPELPTTAGRSALLSDAAQSEARFRTLPAGLTYAVVAEALGEDGTALARGCVDALLVERDAVTTATVAFADNPLDPGGDYAFELRLVPDAASTLIRDAVAAAVQAVVDTAGTPGSLYLDALLLELYGRGLVAEAEALSAARGSTDLDDQLAARLDTDSAGPSVAGSELASLLTAQLAELTVAGRMALTDDAAGTAGTFAPEGVLVGARDGPDATPISIDPPDVGLALEATLGLTWSAPEDRLSFDEVVLTLPLGTLADGTLGALAEAWGLASPGALVLSRAGCDTLRVFLAEQPFLASCDAGCAQAACEAANALVVRVGRAAIAGLDAERDTVRLAGSATLADETGDLRADRIDGRGLAGTWSGVGGSEPVSADALGTRLTAAAPTE